MDNHINLSTNESYSNKIFAHTIKITNLCRFDLKKQNNEFYAKFFNKYYNDLLDCEGYRTLEKLIIKTKQNIFFDPEDDYTFVNDYIFYLNFLKTYNKEKFEWLLNNSKKVIEQDNLKSYFMKKTGRGDFQHYIFLFGESNILNTKNLYPLDLSRGRSLIVDSKTNLGIDLGLALGSYKLKKINIRDDDDGNIVFSDNKIIFFNGNMNSYFDLDIFEFFFKISEIRDWNIVRTDFNWHIHYWEKLKNKYQSNITTYDLITYISKE